MTTTNKTTLDTIPSVSSKRKLKLKKQMSESAVRTQTLPRNGIPQLDSKQIRRMSDSSLMSVTNSLQQLSLQTKDVPAISSSSSFSVLSHSKLVHSKLLKKRLRSLDKKEMKNFSQSFPIYDREKYNADGSLRTMYRLPSLEQLWGQAKLARYLRTPRRKEGEEEDKKEDLLSKQLYPIFKYQTIEDTKYKNKL